MKVWVKIKTVKGPLPNKHGYRYQPRLYSSNVYDGGTVQHRRLVKAVIEE